ncbi:hypothetical protein M9Y10_009211 [Tritrichomonas musculus]|uniref:LisH domain-containing protein n=1 Tax=Tritrichomonas musculus TaxID=1915356 RepID=A0ABR2IMQ5_9EUKA
MKSIDQRIDHLKNQILDGLAQKGILNELQSRFLTNVAKFIQTTDYDVFKPHRERRHTPKYEIAEIVVAQYLKRKNMVHTLQSTSCELKIDEKEIDPNSEKSSQVANKLKIEYNGLWIHQILNDWNENKDILIKQNKEYNRKMFENRLHQIDEVSNNDDFDHNKMASEKNEISIGQDPIWVIKNNNDLATLNNEIKVEEEEEIDNSGSQDETPGEPIWIVDDKLEQNNHGPSSDFVSDDGEPNIFAKQNNSPEAKTIGKTNENSDIKKDSKATESEEVQNSNDIVNQSVSDNKNVIQDIDDNPEKLNNINTGDTEFEIKSDINLNGKNKINNNIKVQNSTGIDVNIQFDEEIESNNLIQSKANPTPSNQADDLEEDIFEDLDNNTNNKKEKLFSDDNDEPMKTPKNNIINNDSDNFDDFDDDFDQDSIKPKAKTEKNITDTNVQANNKQTTVVSSESDFDFEVSIDSEANIPNNNKKAKSESKTSKQESDSLDFSSGSYGDQNPESKQKMQQKTNKIGSNSSFDFDVDFSDEPIEPKSKPAKKTQKYSNKIENEDNKLSDEEFFDDLED